MRPLSSPFISLFLLSLPHFLFKSVNPSISLSPRLPLPSQRLWQAGQSGTELLSYYMYFLCSMRFVFVLDFSFAGLGWAGICGEAFDKS